MVQKITGIIADATQVEQFTKKDGTKSAKCTLKIIARSEDAYPQEVAVNVIGDMTSYAYCKEMLVECGYVNRVYTYTRDGSVRFGNDVYAMYVKKVEQTQS